MIVAAEHDGPWFERAFRLSTALLFGTIGAPRPLFALLHAAWLPSVWGFAAKMEFHHVDQKTGEELLLPVRTSSTIGLCSLAQPPPTHSSQGRSAEPGSHPFYLLSTRQHGSGFLSNFYPYHKTDIGSWGSMLGSFSEQIGFKHIVFGVFPGSWRV